MRTVAIVIGTRPEAIKCAPLISAMADSKYLKPLVVSTGQHREMLDTTLAVFGIKADIDLAVMQPRQTLTEVTQRILQGLPAALSQYSIDAVAVHGDTATTLAGALYAFQNRTPVIHIEAGLRSGNIASPFPEEANRRLVAQISALHLAPTGGNYRNLLHEGVDPSRIAITGNTVIDALHWGVQHALDYGVQGLEDLDSDPRRVVLASAHRRESWGHLADIADALYEISREPGVRVVVPLHKNPVVREKMQSRLQGNSNVSLVEPLPYLGFCKLMQKSHLIISDSSGAEEEGPALGKPTLVLRELTERPEAVNLGTAKLVGRDRGRIVAEATALLRDEKRYRRMALPISPYGDGNATARSLEAITSFLMGDEYLYESLAPERETVRAVQWPGASQAAFGIAGV
ncbi:UDP-N-acetylglucosamine 2-epimerase (non-hydrolyzing) [Xanthomonas hortorum pv. vitians]|nr:UDP-N-acetylglucosamine 2-epimerase (non-hydrolyzing) [Xanthomonas hortorum]MDA4138662.1 UDP-N-acetylglucosamine 2-epimerase (non-hydrolyzing) [Xanthomonas hortorum pv. vitians]QNM60356.1 putative UDP-N-acetylglucosamine 2-epimerase [Xanthomonas hortorum pv. vitians]CAD7381951.1 UDP-N-acetylglucosamine 2-epimerase (non-hydrolyzing) [Xanthomonas arboricola]